MKRIIISILITLLLITGCNKEEKVKVKKEEEKTSTKVHAFTSGKNKQIYFAKSNLEYNPRKKEWKFMDNAYDYVGYNNKNISDQYNGYIDLFSWGATGYNDKSPTLYIDDSKFYGDGKKDITNTNYDFGVYLSDTLGDKYRMFTHDEIHYILMYRKNATKLFGYGTVNNIRGLFILPDDYKDPSNITFVPSVDKGFENEYNWYYSLGDNETNYDYNIFSIEEWEILEKEGVVFLPASGMRFDKEMYHVGISGHYWTSSYYGEEFANCLCLFEKELFLEGNFDRNSALAIRLVKDA